MARPAAHTSALAASRAARCRRPSSPAERTAAAGVVRAQPRARVRGLTLAMPDLTVDTARGTVTISRDVVADVVAETAGRSYGVVGLSSSSRVARMLRREGVGVAGDSSGLRIELHVVVEHGLKLSEVAATVRSQVSYEVERVVGLRVSAVEVVIQNVRQSA